MGHLVLFNTFLTAAWKSMPVIVYCLAGLVVKASASRAENLGFDSRLHHGDFFRSCHTSGLKIGTPVAALSGSWHYRVSSGTGWPDVSIL